MPRRTRKIPLPDGSQGVAEVVPVRASTENWNEYILEDGSVLRMKVVMTEALRIMDAWDENGSPVYLTQSTNILAVSAPDELMRDGGEDKIGGGE